jgi:hypothetical protein
MTFILKNAINTGYIVDPLSSSIEIYTYNTINGAEVLVDEIVTGVEITPPLSSGALNTINFAKDPALNVVGELTSWDVSFTTITHVPQGGLIVISFPAESAYERTGTAISVRDHSG